jgi:glycosyltransferase involved in cell wall biosynthesis
MAGEGPTLEVTRRLAAELGVLERCVFLGFRADIAALLPGFDVTLNCSTREGCSNAILESLVAGVPVLASAVGGNPELVEPGVRGLLHPSGDEAALAAQLASVCGGGADLAAWGRAGREFVQANFTLERFRVEMTGLLRSLAALPRRRPLAPRGSLLVQPAGSWPR